MLPAIGAASAAIDAIQSLTSPQPSSSSQPSGFASILADAEDSAAVLSSGSAAGGFSSSQTSSGKTNALLDAQSLLSAADALDSGTSSSNPSQPSQSASSTYNAINQLTQSTAVPLGLSISA